ncbi:MAG: transcriptional regulator [Solobacterium sp.]|jgi:transcriptional regulator with XRE-family HTH domain|nr:transcriptional regulator [Solobacterium sp.]MCH4049887.1 transcriptional regulator [Solobacterium sp.]MCH4073572.1 transcriptional regulator [Solobacterium sp.]MCI1312943.1 transcriptional regulator [Solobacterium sp.]MCI1345973.1 transcriptional regulator [Solobacterium sp.]
MSEIISENIRHFRTIQHMKQSELAEKLGVTVQAVSRWENGGTPDIALLPALADTLHVSIDALFGRDEKQYEDPLEGLMALIRHLPEEERYHTAYTACIRIMIAIGGTPSLDMLFEDPLHLENSQPSMAVQGAYRDGFLYGSLLKERHYFFSTYYPETSYQLLTIEKYHTLFSCLSDPSVLSILSFFLHQKNRTGCTLSFIAHKTGLSQDKVQSTMHLMAEAGLVQPNSYVSENGEVQTWQLFNPDLVMAVLMMAADLSESRNSALINMTLNQEDILKPLLNDTNSN